VNVSVNTAKLTVGVLKPFRDLVEYRELLWSLTKRLVLSRYKQTVFGASWAIIQPFSLMVVFTLVFQRIAWVPSNGVPYPLFAYTGLLFWTFFSVSVSTATTSLVNNADLVRKVYFPRELFLISAILSSLFDFVIAATIFFGLMAFYGVFPDTHALLVVPIFLIQLTFLLGVVCWTSAMHVKYRDIGHAIPLALQLWMFASPVAYPSNLIPSGLWFLYTLNPLAPIIDGYRHVLLDRSAPDWAGLGVSALIALAVLVVCFRFFKRSEMIFADVI
jgi:lipopolysaccharide transport system permease protein